MTRHPTARRVHRTDTNPDDAFVAGVLESGAWAKQNARKLIIGGVAAGVVILVAVFWMLNRNAREQQAAQQILTVRAAALSGQAAAAIPQLQQFVREFGGTRHGGEARMLLGQAYLQAGQPQQAIEAVTPLAGDLEDDYGVNAAFMVAAAHEAAQQWAQAEQAYARIAAQAPYDFQKMDALDNVGRLRMQQGNAAGAIESYTQARELTAENSPERQVFDLRLGEAMALSATGGTSGDASAADPATTGTAPAATPADAGAAGTGTAGDTTGS